MQRWHGRHVFDQLQLVDSKYLYFGNSRDCRIYWDGSNNRLTVDVPTISETDPGRQIYASFTCTGAVASGKQLTGVQISATFNGSGNNASVTAAEFKARHTTGNAATVVQLRGLVGNADAKNGAVTTAYAVEGSIDVSAGGSVTTSACFHGNLNNSGTVTNSYGIFVEGVDAVKLGIGFYARYCNKGFDITSSTTSSGSANYLDHTSSATSGNIYGLRMFVLGTGVSTGILRGISCETQLGASAQASLLEAGLFTGKVSEGSVTVTNIRVLSANLSIGSSLTVSGDVVLVNAHMQTRGDESISGVHAAVYIKNEAVGGNGLCLAQGAIYITEASLGGGVKGYECLLDASTASITEQTGNKVILLKFKDDLGTVRKLVFDSDANTVVSVET